jgi:hypothetical protein
VGKKKQSRNKHARAKAQREKHEQPRGIHMQFILGFGYQFVSVVLIGIALLAVGYFISVRHWKGVIWFSFALWCCVGLLAAIYAHQHYFPQTSNQQPATKDDIQEINRQLADLYKRLQPPADYVVEKYPGFSLQGLFSLHLLTEHRRKYLFDFGKTNQDRVSIFFDPDNILTLALIATNGETYNVRVAPENVPLDQMLYLSCEIGFGERSTFLRVLINSNQVGIVSIPFKVLAAVDTAGGVMGADMDGKNGAAFDVAEVMKYGTTLNSGDVKQLLEYFSNSERKQLIQFNGKQWLRQGKDKGFHQDISEAMPRIRILSGK